MTVKYILIVYKHHILVLKCKSDKTAEFIITIAFADTKLLHAYILLSGNLKLLREQKTKSLLSIIARFL